MIQSAVPVGPNMTVHQHMEVTAENAARYLADQIAYGDGKFRFVVEYLSLFGGLVAHFCLLFGNRTHRPKLYLPSIYYSVSFHVYDPRKYPKS